MKANNILNLLEKINEKAQEINHYEYGLPLVDNQDTFILIVLK